MSAPDTEIVFSSKFDNRQFEKGIQDILTSIDELKDKMKFDENVKSMRELEKATQQFDTSKLEASLQAIEKRFSALGIAGMTVIQNLTNSTMKFATNLATKPVRIINSALGQIKSGGMSRALNLEHATFQLEGLTKSAKKAADVIQGPVLNAVKGTAYGLDEAAVVASSLYASNVKDAKVLETVLTAVSGAAAMTGRSYGDMGNIFTTVAGQGKLMTMQLRQLEMSGINAAAELAKTLHKSEAEIRDMVTHGQISFEQFAATMSNAFGAQAKKANDTMTGALSNVKAALSRIGADVMTPLNETLRKIYVDLIDIVDAMKKVMQPALDNIGKIITQLGIDFQDLMNTDAFRQFVSAGLGLFNIAMEKLLQLLPSIESGFRSMWNIIKAVGSILKPIAQAFLDIFPLPSIERIESGAQAFEKFTENLKLSAEASETVRGIFRGLFQILSAAIGIIKALWNGAKSLFNLLSPLTGGFGKLAQGVSTALGSIAYYFNVLVAIGEYVIGYFGGLGAIFQAIVGVVAYGLTAVGGFLIKVFEPLGQFFMGFLTQLGLIDEETDILSATIEFLGDAVQNVIGFVKNLFTDFWGTISRTGTAVLNWFGSIFNGAFSGVANFLKTLWEGIQDFFKNFLENLTHIGDLLDVAKNWFFSFGQNVADAVTNLKAFAEPYYGKVIDALGFVIGKLGDAFHKLAAEITPSRIAAAAFLAMMVIMSLTFKKLLETVTTMVTQAANLTGALTNVIASFAGVGRSATGLIEDLRKRLQPSAVTKFQDILKDITKSFLVIFGALYMLSTVPTDKLWSTVAVMGALTAGFLALTFVVTMLAKKFDKQDAFKLHNIKKITNAMMALAAAIAVLAGAFWLMDKINTNGLLVKTIALMTVATTLGLVATYLSKHAPEFTKGAIGIFFFAMGIGRVVGAMVKISQQPMHKVYAALPAIMLIMASFSSMSIAVSKIKLPSTIGLIAIIAALKLCIGELDTIFEAAKSVGVEAVVTVIGAVITSLILISFMLQRLGDSIQRNLKDFAKSMVMIAGAVLAFSVVIRMFENISTSAFFKGFSVIALAMTFMIAFEALSAFTMESKPVQFAASLLLIAGAIGMIGGLAALFGLIPIKYLAKGMLIITWMSAIFGGLMVLSQFTKEAQPLKMGGMFLMLSGAMAILVGVVATIALFDTDKVIKGSMGLAAIIGMMSLVILVSTKLKEMDLDKLGNMFLKLAGVIAVMTICIYALGRLPVQSIIQGGGAIAAFMICIALVESGFKERNTSMLDMAKNILASVLAVLGMLVVVALAMQLLGDYDWKQMVGTTAAISVAILALSASMRIMSDTELPDPKHAAAFLIAAFAMIPIGAALAMVNQLDWGGMIVGAAALSGCIIAYGYAFKIFSNGDLDFDFSNATAFLAASLVMPVIATALLIVSSQPWDGILAGAVGVAAVLIAYGQVFAWVSTTPALDENVLKSFLLGSLALIPIGYALAMVAGGDWQSILASAVAVAGVLFAYTALFKYINENQNSYQVTLASAVPLVAGLLVLEVIAHAIGKIAKYDWKSLLASGAAISLVLYAYQKCMITLLSAKVDYGSVIVGALLFLVCMEVFGKIADAIIKLVDYPWENVLASGAAIAGVLLAFGVCFGILMTVADKTGGGAIVEACEAIILGFGAMAIAFDEVVVIVGGLLTGIGMLDEMLNGDIMTWLERGGEIVTKLAELIGTIAGTLIKAFTETVASALPSIGTSLAGFANNAKPFIDVVNEMDPHIMEGAKSLAGLVAILAASTFIDGLSNIANVLTLGLFKSGNSVEDTLTNFAKAMVAFDAEASKIQNPENMEKLSRSATYLVELTKSLPKTDGFFQDLFGKTDWDGIKTGLEGFAQAMVSSSSLADNINVTNIEKISKAGKYITELTDNMPRDNGLLQTFTGSIDWFSFKTGVVSMANGLAQLSAIDGINDEAIENVKNCGIMLTELANMIPNSGGVVGFFAGNNDLDDFGQQVEKFGASLKNYSDSVKGVDATATKTANDAAKNMVDFLLALQGLDAIGVTSMPALSEMIRTLLPDFGAGLKAYSDSLKGVDEAGIRAAGTSISYVVDIFDEAEKVNGFTNMKDFTSSIISLGYAFKTLDNSLTDVDESKIDSFVEKTKLLADKFNGTFTGKNATDLTNMNNFSKSVEALVTALNKTGDMNVDNLNSFRGALIDFKATYKSFGDDIKTVKDEDIKKLKDQINSIMKAFEKKKGEKLMDFGNLTKMGKSLGNIAKAAEAAGKANGEGNLNDLATALNDLATNFTSVIDVMNGVNDADMTNFIQHIADLKDRFKEMGKIKVKNGKELAGAIKDIADACTDAASEGLKALTDALPDFESKGKEILDKIKSGLIADEKIKNLKSAADKIKATVNEKLKNKPFEESGKNVVQGFINGLENSDKLNGVSKAAAKIGQKALDSLNNKMKIESPSKMTAESGKYTIMGFTKGMESNLKQVKASGIKMGDAALSGVHESLGIHSPATKMIMAAYNTAQGWINGCKSKASEIFGSGFSFGGSFFDGLGKAIEGVKKGDFTGDKMFDKIKDGLGLNKLGKILDDAVNPKDFDNALGKGFDAASAPGSATGKAAKGAGSSAGKAAKDGFTDQMKLMSIVMARNIRDVDITKLVGKPLKKMAKNLKVSVDEYRHAVAMFKSEIKGFDKTTQKSLLNNPAVVSRYVKSYKDASASSKAVVKAMSSDYKTALSGLTAAANKEVEGYRQHIKDLEKERKRLMKIVNSKKSTDKQKKAAKKQVKEVDAEIKKVQKKIKATNPAAQAVNNFADQLYKNSDGYKESKKQIEDLTKAYEKQQKKAKKALDTIGSKKATEKQKKKAYENLQKAYQEIQKIDENLDKEWKKIANGPSKAIKEWKKSTKEMAKEIHKLSNYDIHAGNLLSGFEAMQKATGIIHETAQSIDVLGIAMEDVGSKFDIFAGGTSQAFDMFSVSLDKSANTTNKAVNATINLLERFTKVGTVMKEALFENADSQLEAYEEFMTGINEMTARGFDMDLVAEIAKQGPSALNYIRGFLSMTGDEIVEYNNRYAKKLQFETDKTLEKASNGGKATTKSYVQAIKDEIESNANFEKSLATLASRGLDSKIISKFKEMGKDQASAYVDSLLEESDTGIRELNSLYAGFQNDSFLQKVKNEADAYFQYESMMNQLKKLVENGQLNRGVYNELAEMGREDAMAFGNSLLNNLDDLPEINAWFMAGQDNRSLIQRMKDTENVYKDYQDRLAAIAEKGFDSGVMDYLYGLDISEGTKYLDKLEAELKAAGNNIEQYVKDFNAAYKSSSSMGGSQSGVKQLINDVQSQIDALDDYNNDLEKLAINFSETGGKNSPYYKYLEGLGLEGANYVKALAEANAEDIKKYQDTIDQRNAKNEEERRKSLQKQQMEKFKKMAEFGKNLQILAAAGANTTFLQSILDMGVADGSETADAYVNMVTMDPEGWKTFRDGVQVEADKAATSLVNAATEAMTIAANYDNLDKDALWASIGGIQEDGTISDSIRDQYSGAAQQSVGTFADEAKKYASTPENVAKLDETGKEQGEQIGESTIESVKAVINKGDLTKAITAGIKKAFSAKNMKSAGTDFVKGIKTAFTNDESVIKAVKSLGTKIHDALKNRLTKTKGKTIAQNMCSGLISGFNSKKNEVSSAGKDVGKSAYNGIITYLNKEKGESIGVSIGDGLIIGMDARLAQVRAKAADLAAAAAAAMNAAAKVNSPSKLTMKTGNSMGEGLVVGMKQSEQSVLDGAKSLALYAVDAIKTSSEIMNDALEDTINFNPIIKPILDLSNLNAKARDINGMLDGQITSKADTEYDLLENQNAPISQTFVQNNYSPKALSREEIYRQTKSQLARAREAVSI